MGSGKHVGSFESNGKQVVIEDTLGRMNSTYSAMIFEPFISGYGDNQEDAVRSMIADMRRQADELEKAAAVHFAKKIEPNRIIAVGLEKFYRVEVNSKGKVVGYSCGDGPILHVSTGSQWLDTCLQKAVDKELGNE